MNFRVWFNRGGAAVLICAGLNGCLPPGQGQLEEEKESHYMAGKSCASSMDYPGAIEAFEKAVEVNPRSAAAHFQLGWLYEEKEPDSAAAIYHYERFLKLRTNADNAEFVRQRINNCKQDLAKTIMPLPIPAGMQREFEQLIEDKKQLIEENKRLGADNERLRVSMAGHPQQARTNPPSQTLTGTTRYPPATSPSGNAMRTGTQDGNLPTAGATRTHVVQPGETPVSIAKQHGVKLDDLLKANPGLDPKRMRVGKRLNLPPA
jgi:tetratricopeptide (TPR) repeat protein